MVQVAFCGMDGWIGMGMGVDWGKKRGGEGEKEGGVSGCGGTGVRRGLLFSDEAGGNRGGEGERKARQ